MDVRFTNRLILRVSHGAMGYAKNTSVDKSHYDMFTICGRVSMLSIIRSEYSSQSEASWGNQ